MAGPLAADDFLPLPPQPAMERAVRPSRSYWQDGWRRLRQNRSAFAALGLVLGLLLFALAGPLLWPVDPAAQDLEQLSRPPTLGERALLVDLSSEWSGTPAAESEVGAPLPAARLGRSSALSVVGSPTSQSVRLQWQAVPGARGYILYRTDHPPMEGDDLGLPLVRIIGGSEVSHEDRLNPQPGRHYYSVVATDGVDEADGYRTLAVEVQLGLTLDEARRRGHELPAGASVTLAPHPLGTDYLGRDLLARLIHGARISLFIGLTAPLLSIVIGAFYGGVAGYLGGRTDALLMRFADFVVALPFLLFMILFRIGFGIGPGESGIAPLLLAMVLLGWPGTARLVRGQILRIREEGYVQAARLMGAGTPYLVLRHMLPNTMGVILVSLTFAVPSAIFTEAFLSFIGMGVAPPTPSWGSMCNDGIKTMLTHPHELLFPALVISLTVLAFNLLGDGLRDALDARLRGRE
ncbi:MAG: ABC transporter permease [Pseudomonadales bacterium]|jgi:oligopeptide transport system permease protein|nr:ABC transporter permease [Pseudomonadales bacterium]MCC6530834.1 ABC transporter permease [Pseudomonadales bacterium]MCP5332447.1 ABC transporter permease [Pseudomonadales bacterium]HMU90626.1 ABC transporter permease [Pseudomonadales bacterium]HMW15497.1 ABC transporter permease [Pseudomonadales bacterium]